MVREGQCWESLKQRAMKEKEKLSKLHLITSPDELCKTLSEIDDEDISTSKKTHKKLAVMREQISIRKKLLNQKINIPFTHHRKQRPLRDIIQELCNFMAKSTRVDDPASLVGRRICHKFTVDGEDEWYNGYVISYNALTHLHEIMCD